MSQFLCAALSEQTMVSIPTSMAITDIGYTDIYCIEIYCTESVCTDSLAANDRLTTEVKEVRKLCL